MVSTHSRPKAAGRSLHQVKLFAVVSTHSRPKAAGDMISSSVSSWALFQHTAARRRLEVQAGFYGQRRYVSTHSRPKAAGYCIKVLGKMTHVSTHSRPKAAGSLNEICI